MLCFSNYANWRNEVFGEYAWYVVLSLVSDGCEFFFFFFKQQTSCTEIETVAEVKPVSSVSGEIFFK